MDEPGSLGSVPSSTSLSWSGEDVRQITQVATIISGAPITDSLASSHTTAGDASAVSGMANLLVGYRPQGHQELYCFPFNATILASINWRIRFGNRTSPYT